MLILYVCTGNTCRSPMAEALTHAIAREEGLDVDAVSAGIYAAPGLQASIGACEAVVAFGADLEQHRARQLTSGMLQEADRVLCMEKRQLEKLKTLYPAYAEKMDTLCHAADGSPQDIPDPFGGEPEVYDACCGKIYQAVEKIVLEDQA